MPEEKELNVRVSRVIDAPADAVFDAYVSPEIGKILFAADPSWNVGITCDLRVDGLWKITTGPLGAAPFVESNRFIEIERPRRLVFKSTFAMPEGSSFVRDVEVTFADAPRGGTLMTMDHRGFPSQELRDAFAGSLPSVLDGLQRTLGSR